MIENDDLPTGSEEAYLEDNARLVRINAQLKRDLRAERSVREGNEKVLLEQTQSWYDRCVVLRSALENYGRHFDWCANRSGQPGEVPPPCDCGLTREIGSLPNHSAEKSNV